MSFTPFSWIRPTAERWFLVCTSVLTVGLMLAMNSLNRYLVTPLSPQGIVSFELAGELGRSLEMLASWGESGRLAAGLSLGLDYVFLLAYPASIGMACTLAAQRLSAWMRPASLAGGVLAWALPVAGGLDAIENYALIRILLDADHPALPPTAYWCAAIKFAIVALGLVYVLIFGPLAIVLSSRPVARG